MDPIEERLQTSQPIENRRERAMLNIFHTGNTLRNRINDCLKSFELTDPQYNVLRILRGQRGKPMNLFEVGDRMVHRESNVSRIVDKLEAKGLVQRKEDPANRRRVDITITEAGLAALGAIQPLLDEEIRFCFDGLDAAQIEVLCELLDKIQA